MSTRHFRALRAVAPLALLLLAACSDKQTISQSYQEFMDTKNPGVAGVVSNATGSGTGNSEIDAALGAGDVVRQIQRSDTLEAEARDAADKNDAATAEAKLKELNDGRRKPNFEAVQLAVALQCGESDKVGERMNAVRDAMIKAGKDKDGSPSYAQFRTVDLAIQESERVLRDLTRNQMKLLPHDRNERLANTAITLAQLYDTLAYLNSSSAEYEDGDFSARESDMGASQVDEKRAREYRSMYGNLTSSGD